MQENVRDNKNWLKNWLLITITYRCIQWNIRQIDDSSTIYFSEIATNSI